MKALLTSAAGLGAAVLFSTTALATIDWAGNVWPNDGHDLLPTGDQNVYAQVYKAGVTEPGGQGEGLSAALFYTSDTHGGPFEVAMGYQGDVGSNDEYFGTIPQVHIQGSTTIEVHVIFTDLTDESQYTDTQDQNGNPPPQVYNVVDVLPNDVEVKFTLCMSGVETVGAPCVIGSAPEIGEWGTGVNMTQIDTELYEVVVRFAAGGSPSFEYKFKRDDCTIWESTDNRFVSLPTDGTTSVELEPDSWEFLPIGCGIGDILDEDKEICFELCMRDIDYTGLPCVIGGIEQLGNWGTGVTLDPIGDDLFSGCIVIPAGSPYPIDVEYKYKKDDCETWESVDNRLVVIDNDSPATQTQVDTWDNQELDCSTTPTIEKSWGSIKSTYRH